MIIKSLLDSDLYKFTMQQIVFRRFPATSVTYNFKSRNYPPEKFSALQESIEKEINNLGTLRFTSDELEYLSHLSYMRWDYIDFLKNFQLHPEDHVTLNLEKGDIELNGTWLDTILYEVPILSIVSELVSKELAEEKGLSVADCLKTGRTRLNDKITFLNQYGQGRWQDDKSIPSVNWSDFGTRRRFSYDWHDEVIKTLVPHISNNGWNFNGTSNVYLAMKYDFPPIGTMAHEYIQAGQGLTRLRDSQKFMLRVWLEEYESQLGIALTDTLGFTAFMNDFDHTLASAYAGCRHDSGSPDHWTDTLVQFYKVLGIDATTKRAVYSDGLDFNEITRLHGKYAKLIKPSFGIGTNLTNDVGIKAPQIVLKMTRCNGQPVAKISDSKGKGMCRDDLYLSYLKSVFNIKEM